MSEATFFLLRHGQTVSNQQGKIQGQSNSSLTAKGQQQSLALAKALAIYSIDQLYSSPLTRAVETANIIGQELGLTPTVDQDCQELSFGQVEAKTWPEVEQLWPTIAAQWFNHEKDAKFPDGESREEAIERFHSSLMAKASAHPTCNIAIVVHGGLLAALFAEILGIPAGVRPRCKIDNTSINIIKWRKGTFRIETWGDTRHLLDKIQTIPY